MERRCARRLGVHQRESCPTASAAAAVNGRVSVSVIEIV